MCMQKVIRKFLWLVLLVSGLQASWAFSLLGPVNFGDDTWQVTLIGYNPLPNDSAPPFILDGLLTGPKNIGEGYRRNARYLVYACDANFLGFFGSNGVVEIDKAFAILNNISNVDNYSTGLSEFALDTRQVNYTAQALDLYDLKSATLHLLAEQLGLADSVRYTWALHNRFQPTGATCPQGGPGNGLEYTVVMRNFDITASPLTTTAAQFPPYGQYSPYVNGVLYDYYILENCGVQNGSPPNVDALEIPADPLADNAPVSSTVAGLSLGEFYNGLTRDDVAGLRYLISSNSIQTEVPAAGSLLNSYDVNASQLLSTTNLFALSVAARTTPPATLQALFPGLVINSVSNYFALVVTPTIISYQTNLPGSPFGSLENVVQIIQTTNIQQFYSYTFGNVVTQSFTTNTTAILQTIQVAPANGSPAGSPNQTTTTYQNVVLTNIASGDYYLLPPGACPYNFVQALQTNITAVTNNLVSATNGTLSLTQNLITFFTNHIYVVQPCTPTVPSAGLYRGIQRVQFVRGNFDSLLGQFFVPVTNMYSMVAVSNSQNVKLTFQRIVTSPDFLFSAADIAPGPTTGPAFGHVAYNRSISFDQSSVGTGLAGPGVINSPATVTFDKVGIVFLNTSPISLTDLNHTLLNFVWGSFDGTTNDPVVYPNGTSLANLMSQVVIQVYPATLPSGTNGLAYSSIQLTVTGGQSPYSWALAPGSQLPTALTLSSDGVLSSNGDPLVDPPGLYNFTIQMTDAGNRSVNVVYTFTIN